MRNCIPNIHVNGLREMKRTGKWKYVLKKEKKENAGAPLPHRRLSFVSACLPTMEREPSPYSDSRPLNKQSQISEDS